jgi:hypothetical protein
MTTHDERATAIRTQPAEPEFSSAGTEAPPPPDGVQAESDPIIDDAPSRAHAEPSPAHAEPSRAQAEPSQAREVPPSAEVPPPADDAQPAGDQLLFATDTSGLRSRWDDIQAAFVDDPTECVHKADALVKEVVEQLTTGFSEARSRLEAQWARGEQASTEDLRVALQRYREFFQRLLAV